MPVGAQLIGRPWGDIDLLAMAKAIEATTGHGRRFPADPAEPAEPESDG
jgi:Asp-tRNA(Asn)/Glu-tRNA(Gln) amidotransferase A subunit family amidase